jgi:hypothetical protein
MSPCTILPRTWQRELTTRLAPLIAFSTGESEAFSTAAGYAMIQSTIHAGFARTRRAIQHRPANRKRKSFIVAMGGENARR